MYIIYVQSWKPTNQCYYILAYITGTKYLWRKTMKLAPEHVLKLLKQERAGVT